MKQTRILLCLFLLSFAIQITAQPTPDFLSNQEIFNFNIGDTLQFEYQEDMRSEKTLRVLEQHVYLAKWQSADRQTWFYKRQISRDTQFCANEASNICPVLPQTHRFLDTLTVENLNNNVFPNDLPTNQHPLWEAYEVIGIDRNLYNARIFQERVWGYHGAMLHIERYAKGLGQVWFEQRSEVGRATLLKLVFYHKNGEIWGNRKTFTTTPSLKTGVSIRLYPNPAVDFVEVSTEKQSFNSVKIFNVMGQQVLRREFGYETLLERIDLTSISKDAVAAQGLHFVQLFNGEKWVGTAKVLFR